MNFEVFVNRVKDEIKDHLPETFQDAEFALIQHVKLNNSYAALTIVNQTVAPIVNLEDYYWDYEHGRGFANIMGAIAESIEMEKPEIDLASMVDFEKAKELLFIRVSSAEKNENYLKRVPHTIVEDIAITYHLQMNVDETGVASAVIANDTLRMYGVSVEELHKAAVENSEKLFPMYTFNLHERMRQNYINDMKNEGLSDEEIEMMLEEFPETDDHAMTVVTNDVGVNGAAVIFYPGVMDKLAEITDGDFFVLPSSVHETIIIADRGDFSPEFLKEMVSEINATQVEPWDRLTDEVYHYDPIDRVFEKASSFEERIAQKAEAERNAKKQSIMDKLGEKKDAAKAMIGEKKTPLRTAEVSL
ncbi:MAG: hypothetical protein J6B94_11930 [Lachnospiraceae bacterium]|nr:hypothetical protein [Lachnospiraceae bacterium]